MSTQRRELGVHSQPHPLGANGQKLCFNCRKDLPKGKRYNCSPACSQEWQGKTSPSRMRQLVRQRDKGVCAKCGTDCTALRKEFTQRFGENWQWRGPIQERSAFLKAHGIPLGRRTTEWWDADHIVPVIEGGGLCGLENYQTLCIPCHKAETAELARRRADNRKAQYKPATSLVAQLMIRF